MNKMGFEGKGLGKNGKGIQNPIQMCKTKKWRPWLWSSNKQCPYQNCERRYIDNMWIV
jgi:hypothetical protein